MCDCCDPTSPSPDPVVVRLQNEVERLTAGLHKANKQAEHFEREWLLRGDDLEDANIELARLRGLLREACEYAKADESDWKAWYPRFIPEDWCDRAQAALEGKP